MIFLRLVLWLFLSVTVVQAVPVFQTLGRSKEYLHLGEVDHEKGYKLLDLATDEILWITENRLKQSNELTPEAFLDRIKRANLAFEFDLLQAGLKVTLSSSGKLTVFNYVDEEEHYHTTLNLSLGAIDNLFLLMFHTKNDAIYGVVKAAGYGHGCEITMDDTANYEVFISLQGKVYKGCAYLGAD